MGDASRGVAEGSDAPGPPAARAPRRRRGAVPATAAAAANDEFDDLTETLYQAPSRGGTRRRRPVALPAGEPTADRRPEPEPEPAFANADVAPIEADVAPIEAHVEPVETVVAPVPVSMPAVGTAEPASTEQGSTWTRRRTQQVLVAAALVIALLVGVVVVVSGGGGDSDDPALQAGGQARLTFPSATTAEGADVTRVWLLRGDRGSEFVGTLEFANPTNAPLQTTFVETIPKSLAASVDDIAFDPQPTVVDPDPVVRYSLTLAAGATATVTYEIAVAPDGANRARLDAWAEELETTTATTTTTTTTPATETTTPPTTEAATPAPTTPPRTQGTAAPQPPVTSPPSTEPPPPPPAVGTIVIQAFSAKGVGTFGYSTPAGGISLTAGTPDGQGAASWSTTVDPGSYTLTQTSTPAGFYLSSIECGARSGSSTSITVNEGETVFCRFVNVPA